MFFPYSTDAPVYYWPFTTAALIAINIVVFVLEMTVPGFAESMMLDTGSGLHPFQWLTTNFTHADVMHILSNMLFLWAFGLIVEGKLGWLKTLALYLGIGVVYGAIVQIAFLFGSEGHVLGASAVVFGFMAISLVWAPENSIHCILYIGWRWFRFDLSVKVFVGIYLALEVAMVVGTHFSLSTDMLHAIGAVLGFAIGIWMVKTKRVDCENWDIFSIQAGRHRMTEKERTAEVLNSPKYQQWQKEKVNQRTTEALDWIREQVREGHAKAAAEIYRRVRIEMPDWRLQEDDLRQLILALRMAGLANEAIPLMAEYLKTYPSHAAPLRLALAEALISQSRPAQALKVLAKLSEAPLDARQQQAVASLRAKANKLHEDDPYEVADEDW